MQSLFDRCVCTMCRAFLASGLTVPVAVSSCAAALRKVCEDLPSLSHESSNIAGLLRIGEVVAHPCLLFLVLFTF